ncbi:peptidase M48 [Neptunitalea chrysea]|uniref:Peptidase M48 n=1 Tax=Neptunitalea chrysea TaxID=1647581 RepID=A0A9W6B5E1_9FLAO|nr:M48 family metallopeptidase [Neptunitalea chrysea]GLB51642.1 peptidase M48 [Neptunitalea chrysea]
MKRIAIIATCLYVVLSCKTNPFTGSSTLNFYPNSKIFPTSFDQYNTFLSDNKVEKGTSDAQMITNVGKKIAAAAEKWLTANGHADYLDDYEWEYNLVQDETVNAWCMPGGKIVFYTGILPIAQDETGVAVVMGHEVAHALADHGAQRMSASTLQQLGGVAGNVVIKDEQTLSLFNTAYATGTQVGVMLPFSRKHEIEADKIGLTLMAIAGYNPEEAAELWKRMKAMGSSSTPEFLSTHPSHDTRIGNLTAWAPEAKAEAKKFGVTSFK